MLRGIATVNLYVDDPAAAAAWYAELLGAEPYFSRPGPDGRPAYVEFRIGDRLQELGFISRAYAPAGSDAAGAKRVPGGPVVHWHVDELDDAIERLRGLGAVEYLPKTEHGPGFVTASFVDPFGNLLGVMMNTHYLETLGEGAPRSAAGV